MSACDRSQGWRIPLRTLTPMLARPHSESHIQLIEQSKTRAATNSGHGEFFESMLDMGPDELKAFLKNERRNAEATLLALTPKQPGPYRMRDCGRWCCPAMSGA
jgi:hypothetical protein